MNTIKNNQKTSKNIRKKQIRNKTIKNTIFRKLLKVKSKTKKYARNNGQRQIGGSPADQKIKEILAIKSKVLVIDVDMFLMSDYRYIFTWANVVNLLDSIESLPDESKPFVFLASKNILRRHLKLRLFLDESKSYNRSILTKILRGQDKKQIDKQKKLVKDDGKHLLFLDKYLIAYQTEETNSKGLRTGMDFIEGIKDHVFSSEFNITKDDNVLILTTSRSGLQLVTPSSLSVIFVDDFMKP
jgi:hypothetical protein